MARSPPPGRGASWRAPSWAWAMRCTMASPRPTPAWSVWTRSDPRWNGSTRVAISSGRRSSPVFSTVSTTVSGSARVATQIAPRSGTLWTMALWTRFVVICSRRASEPRVGAGPPLVSMVTPRRSASGRSVSVAASTRRDRSTGPGVNDRWSARLRSSNASVRSMARALTEYRRSINASVSRFGSLRATSSKVWVIASGVRNSWEALAANRCCSAAWASRRPSMVSKSSARSRNSSRRPGSRIRYESMPVAAIRVASVMRLSGASMRPARSQPPSNPTTRSTASATAAVGSRSTNRPRRLGPRSGVAPGCR